MKKLILVAAASVLTSPAFAYDSHGGGGGSSSIFASRGGIVNSASVTQSAGAFAFSQVAQGEHAKIESPRYDPLVQIETGAFVMPYVDASPGGRVYVHDPIGSVEIDD